MDRLAGDQFGQGQDLLGDGLFDAWQVLFEEVDQAGSAFGSMSLKFGEASDE